jgi:putative transposase
VPGSRRIRNATLEELGCLHPCRYLLHDRDTKFCESFREVLKAGGVKPLKLPARSPNLNAFAERRVRSVKEECLSGLILFGESSLRRAVTALAEHYHRERNHQGKGNVLLFPAAEQRVGSRDGKVRCRERLGAKHNQIPSHRLRADDDRTLPFQPPGDNFAFFIRSSQFSTKFEQ